MGHIVVGIDESATAADALRWAVHEGALRQSRVTAVMAWGYLDQRHSDGSGFSADYSADDAADAIAQLVRRAVPEAAAEIELKPVNDLPARALLEASKDADLLVVGARGYGGFVGPLLGSVSQQCVHHTTVPIAIIRSSEPSHGAERARIVAGIDGSADSARALDWALDEARYRDARVTVVHAWRPATFGALDFAAPVLDYQSLENTAKATAERVLAAANTDGLSAPVQTVVDSRPAADALLAAAGDAALIVVGSRGRGGFASLLLGSVSSRVVHHADCPVVVIPPADRRPASAPTSD